MERRYRFAGSSSKPLYRFGNLGQAFTFANRLNREGGVIYSTRELVDEEVQGLRLEDNTEAFQLTLALAEKE